MLFLFTRNKIQIWNKIKISLRILMLVKIAEMALISELVFSLRSAPMKGIYFFSFCY